MYNLPYEGEEEKGELSDNELGMLDLSNNDFDISFLLNHRKLFGRLLACGNMKFNIKFNIYVDRIIEKLGYPYIYYYDGTYRQDIFYMRNLRILNIQPSSYNRENLSNLSQIPELRYLQNLTLNGIDEHTDFTPLENLPDLEELGLSFNQKLQIAPHL